MRFVLRTLLTATFLTANLASAQHPTTATQAPTHDTSYIDASGTAHITRVVPVPQDLSPEAQKFISHAVPDEAPPESLATRRSHMEVWEPVPGPNGPNSAPIRFKTPPWQACPSEWSRLTTCQPPTATAF